METDPTPRADMSTGDRSSSLLDRIAATVLMLVMVALGWVIVMAYQGAWLRLPSLEAEVMLVLGLLVVALVLVSIVALRHTRAPRKE